MLASPAGSDLSVPVLNIEFVLSQQPFPEMAVNLVDTFSQFMGGNFAEVANRATRLNFLLQSGSECIGVRFDQPHQPVGEHHTHPFPVYWSWLNAHF
jgi:hypothetical protein